MAHFLSCHWRLLSPTQVCLDCSFLFILALSFRFSYEHPFANRRIHFFLCNLFPFVMFQIHTTLALDFLSMPRENYASPKLQLQTIVESSDTLVTWLLASYRQALSPPKSCNRFRFVTLATVLYFSDHSMFIHHSLEADIDLVSNVEGKVIILWFKAIQKINWMSQPETSNPNSKHE